jgi:hypothetical protein
MSNAVPESRYVPLHSVAGEMAARPARGMSSRAAARADSQTARWIRSGPLSLVNDSILLGGTVGSMY